MRDGSCKHVRDVTVEHHLDRDGRQRGASSREQRSVIAASRRWHSRCTAVPRRTNHEHRGEPTMKKTQIRKLTLNRETLMPLDNTDLENVNGGNLVRSAIQASKASIQHCSRVISQASRWVSRQLSVASAIESAQETIRQTQGGNGQ
jgi:hypothetical protein